MILLTVLGLSLFWSVGAASQNREVHPPVDPMAVMKERSEAHLYFADKKNLFLIAEERVMTETETAEAYGATIVHALIEGPGNGLMPTLPPATKFRAIYILPNGTAYVDLSDEVSTKHPGGIQMERLSIYSIVNSLILNVSEIQTVKILLNGRDALTLAGHIDLRFPMKADLLLIR